MGSEAAFARHPGLSHLQLSALSCVLFGASVHPFVWGEQEGGGRKVAASACSTSPVWLSLTVQPAWDPSQGSGPGRGFLDFRTDPKSEVPYQRRQKVRVSGNQSLEASGLLCTQSGGWGAPRLNPCRRAGGSDTRYRKAASEPVTLGVWWARSVPSRCTGSGSGARGVRATRPGPRSRERPAGTRVWGRRGRAGRRRGARSRGGRSRRGSLSRSGLGWLCNMGRSTARPLTPELRAAAVLPPLPSARSPLAQSRAAAAATAAVIPAAHPRGSSSPSRSRAEPR